MLLCLNCGTPIGVQQKLMRHADIRTTMNVYGTADAADMAIASGRFTRAAAHKLRH
jgi:integrase